MAVTEEGKKIVPGEYRQFRPRFQLVDATTGAVVIESEAAVLTARSPFSVDWKCDVTEHPTESERTVPPAPSRERTWRWRPAWLG